MASDIHNKDFALRLVLKERLGGTQNWPIKQPKEPMSPKNKQSISPGA